MCHYGAPLDLCVVIFGPKSTPSAFSLLIIQPTVVTGDYKSFVLVHVRDLPQYGLRGIFDIVHSSVENMLQFHRRVWEESRDDPLARSSHKINGMLLFGLPLERDER